MHEPLYKDVPEWIERLEKVLPRDLAWRTSLLEILRKTDGNIRDNYRKHVGDSAGVSAIGAGGRSGPVYERYLGRLEFQTDKSLGVPEHRVTFSWAARQNMKYYLAVHSPMTIAHFIGTIDIEAMNGGTPERYYVHCQTDGRGFVEAGRLVGFNVGFVRFNTPTESNAGKFFVRTLIFPQERHNANPAQLINEVPIAGTGAKYLSGDRILNDAALAIYNTKAGGAGYKIHIQLDIYG